jgi:uncharacterized protein YgbK (DUF1537 family)
MKDSNLVRVLQQQTPRRVGLVEHASVRAGAAGIARRLQELRAAGHGHAIVDAVTDADLHEIAKAAAGLVLVTGGSGLAQGIPATLGVHRSEGFDAAFRVRSGGHAAVIAGSCSVATNEQVRFMQSRRPAFRLSPMDIARDADLVGKALRWAAPHLPSGPILVHASAPADEVRAAQRALGAERAGALVEDALAKIAVGLVELGVDKLVVAGGETSGAVVQGLGVTSLLVGPEIDPGVPWMLGSRAGTHLYLALKSGNFGSEDFFLKAWERLGSPT